MLGKAENELFEGLNRSADAVPSRVVVVKRIVAAKRIHPRVLIMLLLLLPRPPLPQLQCSLVSF